MTFNLDFALFYAYTLALFAFLTFWLLREIARALVASLRSRRAERRPPRSGSPPSATRPMTRFEAFTRV